LATSFSDSGVGLAPDPTKPVTPGVLRTTYQESSSRYMRTRRYPGKTLRETTWRLPPLISMTSSIGMTTSKIFSSMFIEEILLWRLALTLFSYPA
jgi:hypothetical protein